MRAFSVLVLGLLAACDGASSDPGVAAWMQVEGAQFAPGADLVDRGGPSVTSVANPRTMVTAGERNKPFGGTLAPGATAVILALDGDRGAWIVPAGVPSIEAPDEPTFDVTLAFAATAPLGPINVTLHAVDAAGRVGPAYAEPLLIALPPAPSGDLVISLTWDTEADLDLHVVDPAGVEVWAGNLNSYRADPSQPPDPNAWMSGGILDFDSNAGCDIDGRREENVVWTQTAPSGPYVVRVDPAALCGESAAHWQVAVWRAGTQVAAAGGVFVVASTFGAHGPGAGLEALTFEVP